MTYPASILNDRAIRDLADKYRLNPDAQNMVGVTGGREGVNTGSSVEIQDFRDYVPGDDLRMIDWMAYARTDRLVVRLYREEVSPFVDILIDTSHSMALNDGRKHQLNTELARWLFYAAQSAESAARFYGIGNDLFRAEEPDHLPFNTQSSMLFSEPSRVSSQLGRSSVRLVLSDFMDPASPETYIRPLSRTCSRLVLLRCLGPWEKNPGAEGPSRLKSVEGKSAEVEANLDHSTISKYRERLKRLTNAIQSETTRCGGIFLDITADRGLEDILKNVLLPAGICIAQRV